MLNILELRWKQSRQNDEDVDGKGLKRPGFIKTGTDNLRDRPTYVRECPVIRKIFERSERVLSRLIGIYP